MGKYVIAGNWKMNKTPAEATELIEAIKPLVADAACDVVVGVPFVDLSAALEAVKGSKIGVAAQNCHWEKSGAFTGEISAEMLKAMGVGYVILGHSERRQYFGETDVTVQKRVRAALDAGLTVILCVGEYLEQREQGVTAE
ncbi:MAG: triosephosphate isomerase, partial [Kiritimatiellae bacterium]|nr:triosephosphate isomerase [Kiritimatiellia bacterium]